MGWTISLEANRNILKEDVQKLVDNLPDDLEGHFGTSKQSWGWIASTDIYFPENEYLTISGSYSQSGHRAKPMAEYLKKGLEKLGYEIELLMDDF